MKKNNIHGTGRYALPLLAGVSAIAMASAATAQTAPAAPAALNEIVVTGSRVITNGNASPTPQTIISADALQTLQPGPIADAIANLPVFAGSKGLTGNPGTGVTNSAANEMNLRFLGYARTLVLFDGHRIAPTTYDQVVDVDAIPQMLLQRLDTVTGGVSAVYGSDAVAGVVNFVTDTKFNGLKLDVEGGISTYGDDKQITAGIAVGRRFANDRGHVELSYEYHNDPGILDRFSREWGQDVWAMEGVGTAAAPYHLTMNTRYSGYTFGGLVTGATGTALAGGAPSVAALNNQTFATNGVLSPFVNGLSTGAPAYQSGGSGAYYNSSIKDTLITNKFFGRVDYDLTDNIHAYVEGSDSINHTLNYNTYNLLTNYTFSGTNAFLPAAYQFNGTFKLSEFLQDMPRVDTNTAENQSFVIAGLDGKLGDYKWSVSYSHSEAVSTTRNDNNLNDQKLAAALDAVKDPSGNIVCRAALTNSAYSNCVPLNVFGPTSASTAALAYVTQGTQFTVDNGLDDVSGSISGTPFKDWAGPVSVALSGEWRNQTFKVGSNALPTDLAACAGLTYNCTQGTTVQWPGATVALRSPVNESVYEGAIETDIPLLRDLPFAQDVSFNGAARYTNYSVSGSAWTWKAGLVWKVDDEWKLRATRSRDIRAPTLYDLYQPTSVALSQRQDLLTGLTYAAPIVTSGNASLTPEVGNTTTAGFVYQPKWLPRFSFSVDGFYIDVSNAIVTEQGHAVAPQTACYASGGSSPLCLLQTRALNSYTNTAAANAVTTWYVEEINANDIKTYGADFEANYATRVFDNPLALRGLFTWQPHLVTVSPGVPDAEGSSFAFSGGSYTLPALRLNVMANYTVGNLTFGVMERWRSPLTLKAVASVYYSGQTEVPSTAYTNVNVNYHLNTWAAGQADIFLNVQNLFNLQPPPAAGTTQGSNLGNWGGFAAADDPIGRYFTMGIRFRH